MPHVRWRKRGVRHPMEWAVGDAELDQFCDRNVGDGRAVGLKWEFQG
jgi:hypothetical protein